MGLIGGMARTAVIAGTATAVSNRVSRRQANRWAQQDQAEYYEQQQYAQQQYAQPQYAQPQYAQPAPQPAPPPAAPAEDMFEQLEKLGQLHAQGILTDAEFAAQKARILSG
jgi:hypothetical protein